MTTTAQRGAKGQVLAIFAIFLVVLIGATAVTIDYGTWLQTRRDYQNVADAAVLAGGGFLSRPINEPKRVLARRAAWDSLNTQLNLGLNLGDLSNLQTTNTAAGAPSAYKGFRIWVSTPPIGAGAKYPGAYAGVSDRYLFAWVEKDNPSYFSRIFGQGDQVLSAWATSGVFAGQFAVITLRKEGQGPNNAPTDITLDGNNTVLEVANGDVGGNWGMKLTASSSLWLTGDSDAYIVDNVSCGNSCWSANQVSDGFPTFNLKSPQQLPSLVDDPTYPLPSVLGSVPNGPSAPAIPQVMGTGTSGPSTGDITISGGTTMPSPGVGCSPGGPRLGPGWYHDLKVNGCVVLDATHNYSDPKDLVAPFGDYGEMNVPQAQRPGIFYITGKVDIGNGALVVGDGVSLIFRNDGSQSGLIVNAGGAIDLNTGASDGTAGGCPCNKKGAFQSDGSYSYAFNTTSNVWVYSANNNDKTAVGVAVYVVKPAQLGNLTSDVSTSIIKVNAQAALAWQGVLYAPRDNIILAGQPQHRAIGQFIAWTVKLAGGTTIKQTYDGPGEGAPRLVEPRLGQ